MKSTERTVTSLGLTPDRRRWPRTSPLGRRRRSSAACRRAPEMDPPAPLSRRGSRAGSGSEETVGAAGGRPVAVVTGAVAAPVAVAALVAARDARRRDARDAVAV